MKVYMTGAMKSDRMLYAAYDAGGLSHWVWIFLERKTGRLCLLAKSIMFDLQSFAILIEARQS